MNAGFRIELRPFVPGGAKEVTVDDRDNKCKSVLEALGRTTVFLEEPGRSLLKTRDNKCRGGQHCSCRRWG
jgi:hypothetical protein